MQIKPLRLLLLFIGCFISINRTIASAPAVHISATPGWLLKYKAYDKSIPLRDIDNGYFYQLFEEQIQVEKQADYNHIIK